MRRLYSTMIRDKLPASRSRYSADKDSGVRIRCSAPPYKVRPNETETRVGRSHITGTPDIPDLRRYLRLVLSKSSASSNYSHSKGAASPHLSNDRIADGLLRLYAPEGGNQETSVLLTSGNGFGRERLMRNAY